jgi:peptidoglycan/LPS O-acetylase OafA/YrhL
MDFAHASAVAATSGAAAPRAAFLPHIHRIRGLAMLLVIGAHCWPEFHWSAIERREMTLLFENVTVIFMAISGMLFVHLSAGLDYRRYLAHRFRIVISPYFFMSLPAIVLAIFVVHRSAVWPWVYDLPVWQQFLFFLATGKHLAPLWFIPMMSLFILAAPLFVRIDRHDLYCWLLPPAIVAATLLGRDSIGGMAGVWGKAIFMLPAWLAGMAYARHRTAIEPWAARRIGWIAGAVVLASAAMLILPERIDASLVQKLALALLLVTLLRGMPLPAAVDRALGRIADWSFGLYFMHGYVITAFRTLYSPMADMPAADVANGVIFPATLIGLVADIALVTAASMALIAIGKRMLGRRSRAVIGA